MLNRLAVGVHLVDADPGNPRVLRVVVEEIQTVQLGPYMVTNGDDAMGDNTSLLPLLRDLTDTPLAHLRRSE
jgi:hypothetical protein